MYQVSASAWSPRPIAQRIATLRLGMASTVRGSAGARFSKAAGFSAWCPAPRAAAATRGESTTGCAPAAPRRAPDRATRSVTAQTVRLNVALNDPATGTPPPRRPRRRSARSGAAAPGRARSGGVCRYWCGVSPKVSLKQRLKWAGDAWALARQARARPGPGRRSARRRDRGRAAGAERAGRSRSRPSTTH